MAQKKSVSVKIQDQNFNISTDAPPERVKKVADFLNKNLSAILAKTKTPSPYNAAILAALNITEQYFATIEEQSRFKADVKARSKKILGLLESSSAKKN